MRQLSILGKSIAALTLTSGLLLTGCGGSSKSTEDSTPKTASGYTFPSSAIFVAADAKAGSDITEALTEALFDLPRDAVVVLPKGRFVVSQGIKINSAEGLTLTGYGMQDTILDFANSDGDDAIQFASGSDITVRDFGVYEAPKNAIKAVKVNGIHMTYTATVWEGELEADNGAYGLYPLESQNILMDYNYAYGSADAGLYVGQSNNIVVRHNIAENNVAGIEIENSTMADVYNNHAFNNTAGILDFDLPGLVQAYGGNVRIFNNKINSNNAPNVGAGTVGFAPPGTGILILATSDVEIYNNEITDNNTSAIEIASYFLIEKKLSNYRTKLAPTIKDGWSPLVKNIYMHNNTIGGNGTDPQGHLLADMIAGYTSEFNASGMPQTFPAILYGGIGELLSNAGALVDFNQIVGAEAAADGVNYDPYDTDDLICANNNINANPAAEYENVNTGLVFPIDPATPGAFVADENGVPQPQAMLLIDKMVNNTYLSCVQPRLKPAVVKFRNNIYGCTGDDLKEPACAL